MGSFPMPESTGTLEKPARRRPETTNYHVCECGSHVFVYNTTNNTLICPDCRESYDIKTVLTAKITLSRLDRDSQVLPCYGEEP